MALDPVPDQLRHLKKLEKFLISKKIAIMDGEKEFSKIKGIICDIPEDAANVIFYQGQPSPVG